MSFSGPRIGDQGKPAASLQGPQLEAVSVLLPGCPFRGALCNVCLREVSLLL